MNARTTAIKTKRNIKGIIRAERKTIKDYIETVATNCGTEVEKAVNYEINLNWLKRKGFEVTKIQDTKHTYKISWEHKL